MENSMLDILDIMESELTDIQNELTHEEWSDLHDRISSLNNIFESESDENKIEIVTDEMIDIISQNYFLKNLVVEEINSKNLRAAVPPVLQQSETITEHLLYQRINEVLASMNKHNKGKRNNEENERSHTL